VLRTRPGPTSDFMAACGPGDHVRPGSSGTRVFLAEAAETLETLRELVKEEETIPAPSRGLAPASASVWDPARCLGQPLGQSAVWRSAMTSPISSLRKRSSYRAF
jgi:hypothetical protein